MRSFEERKAEILRRSHEKIKRIRHRRQQFLWSGVCIALVCVLMGVMPGKDVHPEKLGTNPPKITYPHLQILPPVLGTEATDTPGDSCQSVRITGMNWNTIISDPQVCTVMQDTLNRITSGKPSAADLPNAESDATIGYDSPGNTYTLTVTDRDGSVEIYILSSSALTVSSTNFTYPLKTADWMALKALLQLPK